MHLPDLNTFSIDCEEDLWRSSSSLLKCDLAIQGNSTSPSSDDYAFLTRVVSELESLLGKLHRYVSAFCPAKDIGEGTPYSLVEIRVKNWRQTKVVNVYLNYENDTYGLWSVDFTWDEYNKWEPVAFRRENW